LVALGLAAGFGGGVDGVLFEVFFLLLGLAMLYFGAEWLVKGSSSLALSSGISPLVVGLTVVAFGTSAPELFVSLKASLTGRDDLAVGNVVGSNICNIGLVLGLAAMLRPLPVPRQILTREIPILLVAANIFIAMIYFDGGIGRVEGVLLFLGVVAYTYLSVKRSRADVRAELEISGDIPEPTGKNWLIPVLILAGLGVLLGGSTLLVENAELLAHRIGVPQAVIGLTLVALGTSLPEVATTVVAVMKREGDLVIGNAIGSCIFNLLAVMGITGLFAPFGIVDIGHFDFAAMLGITFLLLFFVMPKSRLRRWQGSVFLVLYAGYCIWLFL